MFANCEPDVVVVDGVLVVFSVIYIGLAWKTFGRNWRHINVFIIIIVNGSIFVGVLGGEGTCVEVFFGLVNFT